MITISRRIMQDRSVNGQKSIDITMEHRELGTGAHNNLVQ